MGSVDAARQITAGGKPCDLYAPADYLDIDLFLKPAGYASFNIVFAQREDGSAIFRNQPRREKATPDRGSRQSAVRSARVCSQCRRELV